MEAFDDAGLYNLFLECPRSQSQSFPWLETLGDEMAGGGGGDVAV